METNLNSSECALKISRIIAVFVIFVITGTSIGEIIKIKCPICGESLDISEL